MRKYKPNYKVRRYNNFYSVEINSKFTYINRICIGSKFWYYVDSKSCYLPTLRDAVMYVVTREIW